MIIKKVGPHVHFLDIKNIILYISLYFTYTYYVNLKDIFVIYNNSIL